MSCAFPMGQQAADASHQEAFSGAKDESFAQYKVFGFKK